MMDILNAATFRRHVEALMEQYHLPGTSVSILHNGNMMSTAFGISSHTSQKAATSDTLYDIASSSKSLTAAAVAVLVDDNDKYPEVQWTTPIHDLLGDDFRMPTEALTARTTVEDVLSHRTGMALHDLAYLGIGAREPDNARSVTQKLRHLPMASPAKQKYMLYNNMMFTVASRLVEVKTGKPFADFLRENFFEPLEMASTFLQPSSAVKAGQGERLASGHQFDETNATWDVFSAFDAPEGQGAGSIVTSSSDYIKYIRAMLNCHGPISAESRKELIKPRILIDYNLDSPDRFCSPALYCLGWETYHYRGHQVVMHEGLIDGFGSSHFFLPDYDFGAVLLGNSDGAEQVTWILARELIDEALGVREAERPDWATLQAEKLVKDDDDTGDEIEELREKLSLDQGSEKPAPSLNFLVGDYVHPGYGLLKVEIKDEVLFIDANDRGFPCTFTFEHVRTWQDTAEDGSSLRSNMIANLVPTRGSPEEYLASQFVLGANSKGKSMGILLDDSLPDDEMIWFERV